MTAPQYLPQIWTSSDFAQVTGRSSDNVSLMSSRGLLADPTHNYRGKPAWLRNSALAWFTALHDHAAIVPSNDLALSELRSYGIYLCPDDKDHVGLARPELLVMYEAGVGGSGRVFRVNAVETVHPHIQGTRQTSTHTRQQIIRDGVAIGASGTPWTVFYLDPQEVGTIANITPVIQQGRYVTTADVQSAMTSQTLAVQVLDLAFPAQW